MDETGNNESPSFSGISEHLTRLLAGQTVEWCRQDNNRMLTIKFAKGPTLYIDLAATTGELEFSVVASHDCDPNWGLRAEGLTRP